MTRNLALRLASAEDAGMTPTWSGAFDFVDGSDTMPEYEYDKNGNLTKDSNWNISSIEYNSVNLGLRPNLGCISGMKGKKGFFPLHSTRFSLNLPTKVRFQNGSLIMYSYTAAGEKLRTDYSLSVAPIVGPTILEGNAAGDAENTTT